MDLLSPLYMLNDTEPKQHSLPSSVLYLLPFIDCSDFGSQHGKSEAFFYLLDDSSLPRYALPQTERPTALANAIF